jgi:tripartite-type tricarboxylate transporter receptor subunit TctC
MAWFRRLPVPVSLFFLLLAFTWTSAVKAEGAEPFYEGKTVKVIVRSTPGGGYDLMGRVVARHLKKYLPGVRSVIVVNIPGAGGLVAAAYMYKQAKPDGLTIALLDRTAPINQLVHPELAKKADFRKFRYLGSLVKDVSILVIRKATGIRTMGELIESKKKFVPGGTTKSAAGYQLAFAMQLAWNLPFAHWALGYPGASQQVMAMERGENDLIQTTADSLAALTQLSKIGNVLVSVTSERDPRLPNVPTVFEVAKNYPPNPKYWPLVEILVNVADWGRPFVAPPGIPEDRLDTLRDAFNKTLKDPQMIAEAGRLGLFVNPVSGEKQEQLIRKTMNPSPEQVDLLKLLLK